MNNEGGHIGGTGPAGPISGEAAGAMRQTGESELAARTAAHRDLLAAAQPHLEALHRSLSADEHAICLCDEDGFVLMAMGDPAWLTRLGMQPGSSREQAPIAANAATRVLAQGKPCLVRSDDPNLEPGSTRGYPAFTAAAAPLHDRDGQICGVIEIAVAASGESPAMVALPEYVARMIEREVQQRYEVVRFESLRAIEQLTEAALSHLNSADLLHTVLLHLRDFFEADTAAVLLADADAETLEVAAAIGEEAPQAASKLRFPFHSSLAKRILTSHTPVIVSDLRQLDVANPVLRERIRSYMGVSLVAEGRLLGVVHVGTREERRFTQVETEQFKLIADRLALTVDHARLYEREFAARQRAEQTERRFRDLVQSLNAIVWEADAVTWQFNFVSQRAETILGYPLSKWMEPDFWQRMVHPDDLERAVQRRREVLETGESGSIEYRVVAADGRTVWLRGFVGAIHDASGKPQQLRGLLLDVSESRHAERELRRLAAIVESSDDAIFAKDLEGTVLTWNHGAERMYGYTAEEMVGQSVKRLSPPDRVAEIDGFLQRLRRGESIEHVETVRVHKDGSRRDVSLTISPIRDESGRPAGGSTIARDITERKRSEQALRLTEKLAATGRLAASIAHEINNPMASVTNLLYLLQHTSSLDDSARQYVTLAQEELQRIAHITRQMLGFYREADAPVAVKITDVLENVLSLYARKIRNQSIQVRKRFTFDGTVKAFPGEMRQVFSNLVVNALEVTPNGGMLSLHVHRARDWQRGGREGVRVTVCDSGSGILPEHRRTIFEPFFTTKGERGTGLGLWVSNGIVRKHGGYIRVRSSVREGHSGTCFAVFLPCEAAGLENSLTRGIADPTLRRRAG